MQGGGDLSADRTFSINTSTALSWSALHQFITGGISSTQLWSVSSTLTRFTFTNATGTGLTGDRLVITNAGGGLITGGVAQACGGTDKVSTVSATGTVTCTTDQTGGGGSATSSKTVQIVDAYTYSNQPAARNTWGNTAGNNMRADFIDKTTCRSVVQVRVVGATVNTRAQVQFATSSQVTWYQLDGSSATGATSTSVGVVSIGGTANASSSPWVVTTSTFRNDVYLRISAWGGNGAADPVISAFVECF